MFDLVHWFDLDSYIFLLRLTTWATHYIVSQLLAVDNQRDLPDHKGCNHTFELCSWTSYGRSIGIRHSQCRGDSLESVLEQD